MRKLLFPSLIGLAAMPPVLAQQAVPSGTYPIAFKAANPLEQTTRIVSGEFNSDAVLDFAMLQGQRVSVAFDPGFVEASILLPDLYRDIASHSRTGQVKGADLIAVGTAGLQRGSWNHTDDEFQMEDAIDVAAHPLLHAAWVGATKVRTGNVNGDTVPDLIGIDSDMRTILLAMGSSASFVPPGGGFPMVTAAGDVLDLTVMDNDGDGLGELLVLSEWGVELFDTDLTLLFSYAASATNGHIETVRSIGSSAERAAWLRPMPNGIRQLWILNGQPFGVDQIMDVTPLMATNITSGRFDGNNSSDIAVTDSTGAAVRILQQRVDGTFSSTGNDMRTIVIEDLPATDLMTPTAFGDIDADGDLDVLAARSRSSAIVIGRNETVNHVEFAPRILEMVNREGPQLWTTTVDGAPELHIRFEAPHAPGASNSSGEYSHAHPAGANYLEVTVWRSNELADGSFETEPLSLQQVVIPLVEASTSLNDGIRFLQADVEYFDGWSSLQGIQYVTCRYVTLDANLDLLVAFAHNSLFLTDQENSWALSYLFDLPFTWGNYEVFNRDPWYLMPEPEPSAGDPPKDETHAGNGSTNCVPTVVPESVPDSLPPTEETSAPSNPPAGS